MTPPSTPNAAAKAVKAAANGPAAGTAPAVEHRRVPPEALARPVRVDLNVEPMDAPPIARRRFLHLAQEKLTCSLAYPRFRRAVEQLGDLDVIEDTAGMSDDRVAELVREAHVYLAAWGSRRLPLSLAKDRGKLEYVCGITGSMRDIVPIELVRAGVPLSNWGDAPANAVAEGTMLLLLACVKDVHHRIMHVRRGGWRPGPGHGGSLFGLRVGVYGCGVIGRRFVELLHPFGAVIRVYDPYADDLPDYCHNARSLRELFEQCEAIVIHAALSPETERTVTAELLALLPDRGIIVNTARGQIVDNEALFAELSRGHLRAALDVTDPEELPSDHPARGYENLILTAHSIEHGWPRDEHGDTHLENSERVCLDNLKRYLTGKPLKFLMDPVRYGRST